ncbi:MAG: 16S rRNA (cytidine(1402)-2'-O)-methyltransferase [Succinivibrionaceae bacterium]|nr:16S rRNA (cytidine(1402)-2'-O)-methyltransferase [Succinivibrionaceae bacterium]
MLDPALYVVPTPIGNLKDITARAVEVLSAATLVAAEDTRHSRILLNHLGINPPRVISCHDYNEGARAELFIGEIKGGGSVALVSDAGSPLINDPGYRVVSAVAAAGLAVVPLPGPCALITALEAAALPTDSFRFIGFLPPREQELRETLGGLAAERGTTVCYESPHRLMRTLGAIAEILPDRDLAICRELTKVHESVYRLKGREAPGFVGADPDRQRGEFVLVIGPEAAAPDPVGPEAREALRDLLPTTPLKVAVKVVAALTGAPRNDLYEVALGLRGAGDKG